MKVKSFLVDIWYYWNVQRERFCLVGHIAFVLSEMQIKHLVTFFKITYNVFLSHKFTMLVRHGCPYTEILF